MPKIKILTWNTRGGLTKEQVSTLFDQIEKHEFDIIALQEMPIKFAKKELEPELVENYDPDSHPICGPLLKGGPALLAKKYGVKHDDKYITACHFCYLMRLTLIDRFPQYLAPRQVYGLE